MYKDAYQENKIQVSVVQLATTALTLVVVLVIPAIIISHSRQQPAPYSQEAVAAQQKQAGKVAGASTQAGQANANILRIPLVNFDIDLNSEAGILLIGVILLIGLSLIITIYLLLTPRKPLAGRHK